MSMHAQHSPAWPPQRQAREVPFANCVSPLGTRIADWLATAADYYTAAAVYEQLSRLSDGELRRRGFSRATLASDICQACDRAGKKPSGVIRSDGAARKSEWPRPSGEDLRRSARVTEIAGRLEACAC